MTPIGRVRRESRGSGGLPVVDLSGWDLAKSRRLRGPLALVAGATRGAGEAIAITPGFLRSEYVLDQFAVAEETWREAIGKSRHVYAPETPHNLGKRVASLAASPRVSRKSGRVLGPWSLAREYRVTDLDGSRPDWGMAMTQ
ncbi:MAG: hypothetical protein ACREEC_12560 [Thermoplasmata archaeon]